MLSSKQVLAVVAVLDTALNSNSNGRPVTSSELARHHSLSARAFEPTLQELVRRGVLRGRRGPSGGYDLACPAEDISVLDIVRAGPDFTEARDTQIKPGRDAVTNAIMIALSEAEEHFAAKLKQISVRDLMLRVE